MDRCHSVVFLLLTEIGDRERQLLLFGSGFLLVIEEGLIVLANKLGDIPIWLQSEFSLGG